MRKFFLILFLAAHVSAATLHVKVDRGEYRGPLEVAVGTRESSDELPHWLAHKSLGASESETLFGDLPAGIVIVQIRGTAPLHRAAAQTRVDAGELRTLELPIRATLVRGRVTVAGKPLVRGRVELGRKDDLWEATLITRDDGTFEEPLWQQGEFKVQVRGGGLGAVVPGETSLRGADTIDWHFDIPDRTVRGRVTGSDGKPLRDAVVWLQSITDESRRLLRARTAGDGSYEIRGVAAGRHTLGVIAPAFLRPDSRELEVAQQDDQRVDVTLQPGIVRGIDVVSANGVADKATIVVATGAVIRATAQTDAHGHATLPTPADSASTLYVFPADGSLAVRRIEPKSDALRIEVPAGEASIDVATLTTDGQPVSEISLLMRYDGEIVPPEVLRFAKRNLVSDARGQIALRDVPPGTYEFWPYRSEQEANALIAAATAEKAPVVIEATAGSSRTTLRFSRASVRAATR
ncbi:MAG TPA: carboxypeptidase-like regulatory domain-containing protein [Thermoanaerobaculia bacterium]|jgi:hypothetical protein